jgi:hypothetical protein
LLSLSDDADVAARIHDARSGVWLPLGALAGNIDAWTIYTGGKASHRINLQLQDRDGRYTIPSVDIPDEGVGFGVPGTWFQWAFHTGARFDVPRGCAIEASTSTVHRAWSLTIFPGLFGHDDFRTTYATGDNGACPEPEPDGCTDWDARDDFDYGDGGEEEGWDEETGGCGTGTGGGSTGGGGMECHVEWIELEISYDGGITWHPFWEGYANVCE